MASDDRELWSLPKPCNQETSLGRFIAQRWAKIEVNVLGVESSESMLFSYHVEIVICGPQGRPWEGAGDATNRLRSAEVPAEVNKAGPASACCGHTC